MSAIKFSMVDYEHHLSIIKMLAPATKHYDIPISVHSSCEAYGLGAETHTLLWYCSSREANFKGPALFHWFDGRITVSVSSVCFPIWRRRCADTSSTKERPLDKNWGLQRSGWRDSNTIQWNEKKGSPSLELPSKKDPSAETSKAVVNHHHGASPKHKILSHFHNS